MGISEDDFQAKLLATFQVEAEEHLQAIISGVLALEGELSPCQAQSTIETIFREAHSLKGAARSVNSNHVQEICQELESVFSAWKQGKLVPSQQLFDTLHATLDALGCALTKAIDRECVEATVARLKACLQVVRSDPLPAATVKAPLESVAPQVENLIKRETAEPQAIPEVVERCHDKTIRTSLAKLDRLFQEAEEMLMVKLIADQGAMDLQLLLAEYRSREKELGRLLADTQLLRQINDSKPYTAQEQKLVRRVLDFLSMQQQTSKTFRESLNRLTKASQQNAHFIGALVDSLLEDVKKVLMQPVSSLFDAMPRMVRDLAKELNKEIHLETSGSEIEVDKRILEEIKDPLIHLIRNAIDHGIESPSERTTKNKPTFGTIRLTANETGGGNVEIAVSDDGRGFEIEKIKSAATKNALLSKQELATLSEEETIKLAFHSGISTSPSVTDLSGRGLGLGIVSEKCDKLGGHVLVNSSPDQGATFKLLLPLTLATFRGIYITVSGQDFILPTHNVARVIRLKKSDISTLENAEVITLDGRPLSFVSLASVLGLPDRETEDESQDSLFAVLIRSEEKVIAFGADAIHRECEVLVKTLGKQCARVKNIMAATIMESGKVIPILNPVDLIRSAAQKEKVGTHRNSEVKASKQRILVTEDSNTTRLLLSNILETAGYDIKMASDGQEALDILRNEKIDLLLTDVEMPRMTGFELTEKVRAMPSLQHLPIIICTSRGSAEDKERGIDLGADAYLDKSTFSQTVLLSTAKRLL